LTIKELKGVQWGPGAGKPEGEHWPDIFRKILASGKRAQFIGDWRNFDKLLDQVGGAGNFVMFGAALQHERREVEEFLKRHGAL
jgi:hypothetical protein